MGRKLAYSVHVSQQELVDPDNPDAGQQVVRSEMFERGSELPDWAAELVGDHVYEADDDTPPEVAPNGAADGRGPNAKDANAAEKPAKSAPKADWESYARSQGASDDDLDGATKDDLVAKYGK